MYHHRFFSNLRLLFLIFPLLLIPFQSSSAESSKSKNSTITAIDGISVGHYTDTENLKGCTVIRFTAEGATAAVDVRGSAPGTRETDL
ncbi:MAG: peptidase S58 family protein, partial [Desulfobulbaceae bacterium]|nr:peptidase S58 family protein [Desulfobulbaceae bacterium]